VAGNGSVLLQPAGGIYPYGTIVTLSAIPQPGSYFGVCGNAASGNTNPLSFPIVTANRTISSLFAAVSESQASLTVVPVGSGHVDISPAANIYNIGDFVNLSAIANSGQLFTGWTGDIITSENPLNISINQNMVVYANFTQRPKLSGQTLDENGFQFTISGGDYGASFQIEQSTNFLDWIPLSTVTNSFGSAQFLDPIQTNSPPDSFYRAVLLP
jgi:uncharacterized repeat protein (TIGR02543 family)